MNQMESLILRTATKFLLPLLLLFSVFMLLRGHDEPGGGFIGGLVASVAFALHLFAFNASQTRALLGVEPRLLLGIGLLVATLSSFPALFVGEAIFTAQWLHVDLPLFGDVKLSTPLLFDIGVYLVVLGSVMTIVIALDETEK